MKLASLHKNILNYIFPQSCILCFELIQSDQSLCANCWSKLNFVAKPYCNSCGRILPIDIAENINCLSCIKKKPTFDKARSIFTYDDVSKRLIHHFKYYDRTILAKTFTNLICNRYQNIIDQADLIIPIPMHRIKRIFRLYNQAAILAKAIATHSKKPISYEVLVKTRWTKAQTSLTKKQRLTNLFGSFAIKNKSEIKDKNIILIDDVMTTGSTVSLCASLLKKAGAKKVIVITVAST